MPKRLPPWPGPPEVRSEIVQALGAEGEAFARFYLDELAGWQHLPVKAVVCRTGYAAHKLSLRCGSILKRHGISVVVKEVAA